MQIAQTKKHYPGKKFDDLAESTRKKYYYDAIHEYEARTIFNEQSGATAYMRRKENPLAKQRRHKRAIIQQIWREAKRNGDAAIISQYAETTESEFFQKFLLLICLTINRYLNIL